MRTRLYGIYYNMKQRCENIKNTHYEYYGGKGITVCDEWNNFKTFELWSENNGYSENLTIDRINGDLGYTPNNCRWVTRKEQSQNIKSNRIVTVNNVTMNICQWSELLGININTLYKRANSGKTELDFISPIDKLKSNNNTVKYMVNGENLSLKELSIKYGIKVTTIRSRIKRGKSNLDLIKAVY